MHPKIGQIRAVLTANGWTYDGCQCFTKGDRHIIATSGTDGKGKWNIGSLANTSWPGVSGRSATYLFKALNLEAK